MSPFYKTTHNIYGFVCTRKFQLRVHMCELSNKYEHGIEVSEFECLLSVDLGACCLNLNLSDCCL